MTPEKYAAAKRLNELENQHKVISEQIAQVEKTLIATKDMQAMTAMMIAEQRRAVAAMPDGDT